MIGQFIGLWDISIKEQMNNKEISANKNTECISFADFHISYQAYEGSSKLSTYDYATATFGSALPDKKHPFKVKCDVQP